MANIGKRTKKIREGFDPAKAYPLDEAVKMVKERAKAKFDETIEIAMNLGVDPKHADQMVRGTVVLPHGLGKSKRVAAIAGGEKPLNAFETLTLAPIDRRLVDVKLMTEPEIAWLERYYFLPPLILATVMYLAGGFPWLVSQATASSASTLFVTSPVPSSRHLRSPRSVSVGERSPASAVVRSPLSQPSGCSSGPPCSSPGCPRFSPAPSKRPRRRWA